MLITVHPSSLLRLRDEKDKREAYATFVQDLRSIAPIAGRPAGPARSSENLLGGMIALTPSCPLPPYCGNLGLPRVPGRLSRLDDECFETPQGPAPVDQRPGRFVRVLEPDARGLSLFC